MGGPGDTTALVGKPCEYSVVEDLAANASNALRRREIDAYLESIFRGKESCRRSCG